MKAVDYFNYEELCILIPVMRRASKKYVKDELDKFEAEDTEMENHLISLKEKINSMDEFEIRKVFDELPSEAY